MTDKSNDPVAMQQAMMSQFMAIQNMQMKQMMMMAGQANPMAAMLPAIP